MCFSEYFAVIPKGCCAKNKHACMFKDVTPCFETVFLAMAQNAEAGGNPATLNITLCDYRACVKIDCFRQKLEAKALQTKDPYCPICRGEKTTAEALMVPEDENTQYAFLPNGNLLCAPDNNNPLPQYVAQRQFFLKKKVMSELKPTNVKSDMGSNLCRAALRSNLPENWDDSDVDAAFNIYVSMFLGLYDMESRENATEVSVADLPWFFDTWTDEA
ncbi:hypothetical protein F1880_006627 [Penicillium rolfsii]|nr:hypothetical protein F1880_006627 [Penicillium rolfsii]